MAKILYESIEVIIESTSDVVLYSNGTGENAYVGFWDDWGYVEGINFS